MPMKIVFVAPEGGIIERNREEIQKLFSDAECRFVIRNSIKPENVLAKIKEETPDLLVTENLEGFEMETLTDAVAYNLLHNRQLHMMWDIPTGYAKYLEKQLSLWMYFYAKDEACVQMLQSRYPNLPGVYEMSGENAICMLQQAVEETLRAYAFE